MLLGIDAPPVVQRRRRDTEFGGDLHAGLACSGQLVRAAQFAHDVLRGMPLPTSHLLIVPSSPTSGHRTLELDGLIHGEHASSSGEDGHRVILRTTAKALKGEPRDDLAPPCRW